MKKIIAANWKMNKTNKEAKAFFVEYAKLVKKTQNQVMFFAPFTTLPTIVKQSKELGFVPGAQNFYPAKNGAYTGEISLGMITEAGVRAVLVGHSERRSIFKENDDVINQKIKMALEYGFKVVFCIGETLEERESGKTQNVLKKQIDKGLKGINVFNNLVIAYEPVWAIGTGLVASVQQIRETHAYIKSLIDIPLLYGGSVNDTNATEILSVEGVDGALVGGASLDAGKFARMVSQ